MKGEMVLFARQELAQQGTAELICQAASAITDFASITAHEVGFIGVTDQTSTQPP